MPVDVGSVAEGQESLWQVAQVCELVWEKASRL